MPEASESFSTSKIPWRRSWIVLLSSLALPWLMMISPSCRPQHGDMTFLFLMGIWLLLCMIWGGCTLALTIRRIELIGASIVATGMLWINFVLVLASNNEQNSGYFASMLGYTLVLQMVSSAVTLALRFPFTLAHQSEVLARGSINPNQYSLRALLYSTVVLAVITALLSAAVRTGRIRRSEMLIPWLLLMSAVLLWNELLQPRLRWANVGVCTLVWLGIIGWSISTDSHRDFVVEGVVTSFVYGLPVAYRWAGWRMVRREFVLP